MGDDASADPYRLRGDVFVSAEAPVGLVVLHGEDSATPWLDAEAMVWTGATELKDDGTADALVIAVRLRDPKRRGEARVGRFVIATGAVRPVHIDGALVTAKAPWGSQLEVFGGLPVVAGFAERDYDWLVGTRASHRTSNWGDAGVSFYHRRDRGRLDDQELGADYALQATDDIALASRVAFDLTYPGIADAHGAVSWRKKKWRHELFASSRSPSRLLPASSLFAAIGDVASTDAGVGSQWRAAPRLDVRGHLAARHSYEQFAVDASMRATLRLDESGVGALGLELRRSGQGRSGWTGARGLLRVPFTARLSAAAELELAVPDDSEGRGTVWPWGLAALSWHEGAWDAAVAVEASRGAEYSSRITGLFRLTRRWGS